MSDRDALWVEVLSEDWSGPMRLQVQGLSMWPSLRPGDRATVEPVTVDALRRGAWVVLRRSNALVLHRFLGFTCAGLLLTKGDNRLAPDAPWPREALVGHVVAFSRQGRTFPVSSSSLLEKTSTSFHYLTAMVWTFLRAIRGFLIGPRSQAGGENAPSS
jgi:hypothetical protein